MFNLENKYWIMIIIKINRCYFNGGEYQLKIMYKEELGKNRIEHNLTFF